MNDPCPLDSEPATPLFLVSLLRPQIVYTLLLEEPFHFFFKLPLWVSPLLWASVGL